MRYHPTHRARFPRGAPEAVFQPPKNISLQQHTLLPLPSAAHQINSSSSTFSSYNNSSSNCYCNREPAPPPAPPSLFKSAKNIRCISTAKQAADAKCRLASLVSPHTGEHLRQMLHGRDLGVHDGGEVQQQLGPPRVPRVAPG